ncbi:hypothetical protein SEA_UTZCHIPS_55 [Microbacterium phage UtzChips]|nr:hypothetical protein SEA_UTZCHIPS_55 [Microbacterium phage UtzChips]
MKRKTLIATVSVVGALTVVGLVGNALGLGGSDEPTATPTSATAPSAAPSAPSAAPVAEETPEPSPEPSRCLVVADSAKAAISEGLHDGIALDSWAAVRSDDRETVWLVSATGSGGILQPGDVVTFATTYDPTVPDGELGITLTADGFAHQIANWPYGPDTKFGVSFAEDGGSESRACAKDGF